MFIREYQSSDCKELAELFNQFCHDKGVVNFATIR